MGNSSSEGGSIGPPWKGASIELPLPVSNEGLFKHKASPYVINFLADNPDINVSIRQLANVTPVTERSTREAVDALEKSGLVESFRKGSSRRVQIAWRLLHKPDDPITSIQQPEFHMPVRVAVRAIHERLEEVMGIILFGSVARGEADRQSDIDLWVLVGGDHMKNRNEANKISRDLKQVHIPETIPVQHTTFDDLYENLFNPESTAARSVDADKKVEDYENYVKNASDIVNRSTADRYQFEILVETPKSIVNQKDRVEVDELFGEGITIFSTETLEKVKEEMVDRE